MKKITAVLGSAHNDFDRQVKDVLNELSESVERILVEQHNFAIMKNLDAPQSKLCDVCHHKADMVTTNLADGSYKSFCNKCLLKK